MSRLASDRVRLGKLSQLLDSSLLIQPDGQLKAINKVIAMELPYKSL